MNISIGDNIKNLRKNKNITQEKLAEHLNISCQAISKWERGETYPDITMIIPIANYFNVTTDEILGFDQAKNELKVKEYLEEYDRLSNLGMEKDRFEFINSAYHEFPNDFKIIEKYMWALNYDPNCGCDGRENHMEELLNLCDYILNECVIDDIRYSALSVLSGLYLKKGNIEKAIETVNRFPKDFYQTAGQEFENLYDRGTDEWRYWIRKNIYELSDVMIVKIRNSALYSNLPPDEKIKIFMKAVDYIKLIYEDTDYGFCHYHLCELYIWIANRYIELDDHKNAEEYLNLGLSHAKSYDELPEITTHTSFLVKNHIFERNKVYSGFEGNDVMHELKYIEEDNFYDKVRGLEWFENIINNYKQYAKDKKY